MYMYNFCTCCIMHTPVSLATDVVKRTHRILYSLQISIFYCQYMHSAHCKVEYVKREVPLVTQFIFRYFLTVLHKYNNITLCV
jgi:hypothetical protein